MQSTMNLNTRPPDQKDVKFS